ncbi:MAG: exodeoxyribonuclease V subunit gamma, partial [Casimicrobiaceae bacterium]
RAGEPVGELRRIARAGAEFPSGPYGALLLDRELALLASFAQALAADTATPPLPPAAGTLAYDVDGAHWRLEGMLDDLRANGRARQRYANVQAHDYLRGWIEHLLLNALRPPGIDLRTAWHSRDGTYRLAPLDAATAHEHLRALVAHYARGLVAPLPFFARASWAYVECGGKIGPARAKWIGSPRWGEQDDTAFALAFRGRTDPLDDAFTEVAVSVLGGILDHIDDPRLRR